MLRQIFINIFFGCCLLAALPELLHAAEPAVSPLLYPRLSLDRLINYQPPLTTTIYAKDGSVLAYFFRENRFFIDSGNLPDHVKNAFIAAEDSAFYIHDGVDPRAVFRALSYNVETDSVGQGGSTITQQVVKNVLLSDSKRYERKIKEAILACQIENILTKEQILTIYLNEIYMGSGAYGVEAAARIYFNKHAVSLSLAEAALLAGLPKAPSRLNPHKAPNRAKKRQYYVLNRMLAENLITGDQYQQALAEELTYRRMSDPSWQHGAYYLAEVRRWLIKHLSREALNARGIYLPYYGEEALYKGGFNIYTAFDRTHQAAAEKALSKRLEQFALKRKNILPLGQISLQERESSDSAFEEKKSPLFRFKPGEWVKAVVVECKGMNASVKVGEYRGTIRKIQGKWNRNPDYPLPDSNESENPIRVEKVLMPGDVVYAKIVKVSQSDLELMLTPMPEIEGALFSMAVQTGEVKALVGGYNYRYSKFNRATQAFRQPGSLFKPVVFSAALASGYTAASMIMDMPLLIGMSNREEPWMPMNFSETYQGPTLLSTAMTKSLNVVTARLAQQVGIEEVILQARRMGIESHLPPVPSISLGAAETNLMELVRAYSSFPRGGTHVEPRVVLSVYDRNFELLLDNPPQIEEAMSPQNAYIILHLLKQSVQSGTGWRARISNLPVAGKTGTSNNMRDAWFIGFTPDLLTGVYVGFDNGDSMGEQGTGGKTAAPIWTDYYKAVKHHYRAHSFKIPENIFFGSVTRDGKYLGAGWHENGIVLAFEKCYRQGEVQYETK